MRKFLAVAMGSMLALVGFAGAANASATVDLLWGNGADSITDVPVGSNITANVQLTAGPNGISSVSLSVDYSDAGAAGSVSVVAFSCIAGGGFDFCLSQGTDSGSQINSISAAAFGGGMAPGSSHVMGTVTFQKVANPDGDFVFPVGALVAADDIFDGQSPGVNITDTSTYNPAFLVNVPEPGAISMLVMGLGGMLLAGRGRRS
jgi:hypothetical protein